MNSHRTERCLALIAQARAILNAEGTDEAALEKIKDLLMALADQKEALFPMSDFAMPYAQGRNHILALEEGDGMGLYLTIGLPGKQAAPHDHGVWCVNAAVSGQERHRFYRRTDDGAREGYATIEVTKQVLMELGQGTVMTDHAIHGTEVVGETPAIGLVLYGYTLARFPAVVWFHPEFSSTRTSVSRRTVYV